MPSDDPFDDPDDDAQGEPDGSGLVKNLRAQLDERAKELKRLTKENAELSRFKAETDSRTRAETVKAAITSAGLKPQHADLFLAVHGTEVEPTEEVVKTFAEKYDLAPAAAGSSQGATITGPITTVHSPSSGFYTPTASGTPVSAQPMSKAEWNELYRRDPARAMQVRERVRFEHIDNPLAG